MIQKKPQQSPTIVLATVDLKHTLSVVGSLNPTSKKKYKFRKVVNLTLYMKSSYTLNVYNLLMFIKETKEYISIRLIIVAVNFILLLIFIEASYVILHKLRFAKFYICKLYLFQIGAHHTNMIKKMEHLLLNEAMINAYWHVIVLTVKSYVWHICISALPLREKLVEFWNSSVSASPSWRTRRDWKRFTFSDKLVAGVDGPPISGTDRFTTFFAFLQWQGWLWNTWIVQAKNIYETGTSHIFRHE